MQQTVKDKVTGIWGLFSKYKILRWGLLFVMICLGLLILSASRVSFFGITIERETTIEETIDVDEKSLLEGVLPGVNENDEEKVGGQ